MFIAIAIVLVLLAALLVPLILTGDIAAFFKRYALILSIGLVAAVVAVLINMIAQKATLRTDLTEDQRYSVSSGLRNIVGKLNDPVQIVYYVSPSMQEYLQVKLDMIDKLNEVKSASHGMLDFKVEDVDPNDKKLREELGNQGFLRQIPTQKNDEVKFSIVISGMKITYKALEPVYIPAIYNASDLEYALGDKLLELYVKDNPAEKPVIAVDLPPAPMGSTMPGQPQQGSGFEWIVNERSGASIDSKKFDVKSIEINQNSGIPDKTSLLIMIRPKLMEERQKYEVEKYLAEGGHVMLLASPVRVDILKSPRVVDQTPFGLEDYLKDCGIVLGKGILADNSHLSVPVNNGSAEVPSFIRIKPENIDQSTSLTALMPALVMPTPTAIELDDAVLKREHLTATVLAKTTDENWELRIVNGELELDRDAQSQDKSVAKTTPKTVFAMIKGQFPFPFEGKPIPEWPGAEKDKPKGKETDKDKDKDKPKTPAIASITKHEGTLVICSAPEAFYAPYLDNGILREVIQRGNIGLLLNVTESMSYGNDLVQLRTKRYATRTISKLSGKENETKRQLWKLALIAAIPLLVLFFAVYRFTLRRVNQLSYERKYAGTTGPSSFSA